MSRNPFRQGVNFVAGFSGTPLANVDVATIAAAIPNFDIAKNATGATRNSSRTNEEFIVRGEVVQPDGESKGVSVGLGGATTNEYGVNLAFNEDDPILDIMEEAFESGSEVAFFALSGGPSAVGSKGWVGNAVLTQWNIDEPQSGVASVAATLIPTDVFKRRYAVTA